MWSYKYFLNITFFGRFSHFLGPQVPAVALISGRGTVLHAAASGWSAVHYFIPNKDLLSFNSFHITSGIFSRIGVIAQSEQRGSFWSDPYSTHF